MSAWIDQIFKAGQVTQGNIVRRSMTSVQRYSSVDDLEQAVRKKNFHMAVIGEQYVIVCNKNGTIHVVC